MPKPGRLVAVLSDLHLEEEASDRIGGGTFGAPRNLAPRHLARFLSGLVDEARDRGVGRIDLVLAGDIFDVHRSQLWQDGDERPWLPSPALADRTLGILETIAAEPDVAESLRLFAGFATGRVPKGEEAGAPLRVVDECAVELHYLPGNHDRLIGTLPALRHRARQLLGLPWSDAPFAHSYPVEPGALPLLVRHGHEYDRENFRASYDLPAAGDVMTVDVAAGRS